jgi:hypothetical protein
MNGIYGIAVVQAVILYFVLMTYWSEKGRTKKLIRACAERYNLTVNRTYETWRLAVEVQVSRLALDALKNGEEYVRKSPPIRVSLRPLDAGEIGVREWHRPEDFNIYDAGLTAPNILISWRRHPDFDEFVERYGLREFDLYADLH